MDRYTDTRRFLAPFKTTTGKVQYLGIFILSVIALLALFAPFIAGFAPDEAVCAPFERPSSIHILGCDDAGHSIFSQLLFGARVSLFVGLSVAFFATLFATILAVIAGYYGGWIDRVIMRVVDIVLSLPFLPLVIVLGVALGASLLTQIVVIAVIMWAQPVRELRSQILSIRSFSFVEASKAMGASGYFIGLRHILPEVAPLIVPVFVRIAHGAILIETSLSFLGLGDPLQTSWGTILYHANSRTAFLTGAWLYWIVPAGVAVALTVTALAFIGFGYDASLSPRILRRKKVVPNIAKDEPSRDCVLSIRGLRVSYYSEFGKNEMVRGVDLDLKQGELLGLVGESGSGKTTVAMAILQLLTPSGEITDGVAQFQNQNLFTLSDSQIRSMRGRKLALIPQSAMNSLNPVMTIGTQLAESLNLGDKLLSSQELKKSIADWLKKVGLEEQHAKSFPHELSGGMRQRAVIAIAICNTPDLVIADEPTTGLDVLVQEEIMALLLELRLSLKLSILFITHNLSLIARHADSLAVMHRGIIVDYGSVEQVQNSPKCEHTRSLFDSLPKIDEQRRWGSSLSLEEKPVIELRDISKSFNSYDVFGLTSTSKHKALTDVSLKLYSGEKLGLVGGSGSGKSTIARLVMGMIYPDTGEISFKGRVLNSNSERKTLKNFVHMVFQDPYQSMRNSMSIRDIVAEPLYIRGIKDILLVEKEVKKALKEVGLPSDGSFISRLPVALSGGQRQRVSFARAIITKPEVIIADEPTSMLDQSTRGEIVDLMEKLRVNLGTTFLFITHDIVLARHFCNRLVVLKDGLIVEEGLVESVIESPKHEYTKALISAV